MTIQPKHDLAWQLWSHAYPQCQTLGVLLFRTRRIHAVGPTGLCGQENHVISSLQSTKLQQGLQQVFTDLHSSKQMITNLQRELHHTRTLWANESLQYTATAAQLQQSSVKLLERHFRVPDGPSHIGVISSSSSPEISGPMLQRREPNVATMGTAQHAQQVLCCETQRHESRQAGLIYHIYNSGRPESSA